MMSYTEIDTEHWVAIAQHISQSTHKKFAIEHTYSITGGCINEAFRVEGAGQQYFVKLNQAEHHDMFTAEAAGLAELSQPAVIKIPLPVCYGSTGEYAYLVTEYCASHTDTHPSHALLGQQLAVLHQVTQQYFGWFRNNRIGTTLQKNDLTDDWVKFWCQQRLGFQLQLAAHHGYTDDLQDKGHRLLEGVHHFFSNYTPLPSLLHGDLWSGNFAVDIKGQPIIFDPAVYYGDRETDIALTELFGGFDKQFYATYNDVWELDAGYLARKPLYNLYHILNHLNLFGGNYLGQAKHTISQLLSELR